MIESAEDRRKILGGSEICAAAGLDPYQSQYKLWEVKRGLAEPFAGNEATKRGVALEDWIRREASKRIGISFRRSQKRAQDKLYPWMIAHYDGIARGAGLECKTTSFRSRNKFAADGATIYSAGEGLPINYYCQVQQYMAISGKPLWYLAVEILGDNDLRILEVPYNAKFTLELRTRAAEFWENHVRTGEPPDLVLLADINERFTEGKDEELVANAELLEVIEQFQQVKTHRDSLAQRLSDLEASIKQGMGEISRLVRPTGELAATWKNQDRSSIDTTKLKKEQPEMAEKYMKTTSSRVFRVLSDE